MFDGEKIARVEQPEAGMRDFHIQEGQSIYSPLVSVHDEAADTQYWYLFDALGSTMGLVDSNGNLSGKLQYDAFGNVLAEESVPRSAFFKYVGAYQYMPEDFEGMMLLWHRWYDPTVGRFVARDARRGSEFGSPYAYQRPVRSADAPGDGVVDAVGAFIDGICSSLMDSRRDLGADCWDCLAGIANVADLFPGWPPKVGAAIEAMDCLANMQSYCQLRAAGYERFGTGVTTVFDCLSIVVDVTIGPIAGAVVDVGALVVQQIEQGGALLGTPLACCRCGIDGFGKLSHALEPIVSHLSHRMLG